MIMKLPCLLKQAQKQGFLRIENVSSHQTVSTPYAVSLHIKMVDPIFWILFSFKVFGQLS